jgi:segregation and condensation protein B
MSETGLVQIIEGALLAAGKPMTVAQLADLFEEPERPENTAIREALDEVSQRCEDRGFELQQVASGFRFQVRQNLSPWIGRLWHERPQRYSRALLETLALIAYRQPITRGEIEEIRGVAVSSNIIKTLHEREWIRVVGHRDVPGRPAMYATTKQFLDYFSLKSLDQLPALAEIRDLETLNAELGFSEPLPEGMTDKPETEGEAAPELTVVGGTEHTPEGEEARADIDADEEQVEAQVEEDGSLEESGHSQEAQAESAESAVGAEAAGEIASEDTASEDDASEDIVEASLEDSAAEGVVTAEAEVAEVSEVEDAEESVEKGEALSLSDIADALESRAVEPIEDIEDDADEAGQEEGFAGIEAIKPESQA